MRMATSSSTRRGRQSGVDLKPPQAAIVKSDGGERCGKVGTRFRQARNGTMSAEDFEVLRRHMLAVISAGTFHVSGLMGKAALDERVMTAMGKVPRHEFVPI